MATDWHVPFFSGNRERGCQGWEVILHSVNTSEREGKKAKTSSPCTGVLQGDNYFLLPSSVTLPAASSLETLHGTHRSKTKHERRGSESVRQKKRILCVKKTNKQKKATHVVLYTECEECWEGGNDHEEPMSVFTPNMMCVGVLWSDVMCTMPYLITWVWRAHVCRSRRWSVRQRWAPSGGGGTWGRVWLWWACPFRPDCPRSLAGRTRPPAAPRIQQMSWWTHRAARQNTPKAKTLSLALNLKWLANIQKIIQILMVNLSFKHSPLTPTQIWEFALLTWMKI